MACVKLGSKSDTFQRKGQVWFCTTDLPSDIVVEVGEMSFNLHKFPLLSRSGVMERMISEASKTGDDKCQIRIPDLPGGDKSFELVVKFCYGIKFELTASNAVYVRCAAEHLEMTEEYGEGNLVSQTEVFLNQVVLKTWKDSLKALQSCEKVLKLADELDITKRCIESLAAKASTDPNLLGWPVGEHGRTLQSPDGSILWNGISTGARFNNSNSDWWYEDSSMLSFVLFKRLITVMESRGIIQEAVAGSLIFYARKFLPGLNRCRGGNKSSSRFVTALGSGEVLSEEEQRHLLEEIEKLLPLQKNVARVTTKFLFEMLRTAKILKASPNCISSLEKRIGMQLDQAALEDLVMPSFSDSLETLYDVDCVQRILDHFLVMDQIAIVGGGSPCSSVNDGQLIGSPSLTPVTLVAKLIDEYLAEVAPDVNLKLPKFQALAAAIPEYARPLDDSLYRAIDVYLKHHPWLAEPEREQLCRLMDCQKLSLEACTHAAQNERLPLRIIVQVLFFEQLQLRTSVAGCFLVSDNLDGSRQLQNEGGWPTAVRENQVLKVGMDNMRMRVSELEKECSEMREEIEKLGGTKGSSISTKWGNVSKRFSFNLGLKLKSHQMCSAEEGSVSKQKSESARIERFKYLKDRRGKHTKTLSIHSDE